MYDNYEVLKYTHDMHPESHIHEFFEIFISLSNEGKFFVKETGYSLRFGTAFFLNPFEIHRCFCRGKQDYNRYVIHMTSEYLRSISTRSTDLEELFFSAPVVLQLSDDVLADSLKILSFLSESKPNLFGVDIECNIHFESFLLEISRYICKEGRRQMPLADGEKRVNVILKYIHNNYYEDITIDKISKHFYISKSRLSQIFKESTGFSVGDYIITYRLKRACQLLHNGFSVQEVGEKVGFHSSENFIRIFKKHIGISPGRFSKENRKDGVSAED